jgi:hypothetical protein
LDICITSPKDVHSREFDGEKERGIKVFVCVVGNYEYDGKLNFKTLLNREVFKLSP